MAELRLKLDEEILGRFDLSLAAIAISSQLRILKDRLAKEGYNVDESAERLETERKIPKIITLSHPNKTYLEISNKFYEICR